MPNNFLPLHLKHTLLPMIWIFTEGKCDGIKSRLPLKNLSTLPLSLNFFGTIYHVIIFSGICCFLLNKRTSPHFICHNWAKIICYWFWITFIKAECTSKLINYSMCLVLLKSSVWNVVSLSPKKLEKSQKTHGLRGASSHRSQTKEFYRWEDTCFQMNFPSFCSLILNNTIKVSKNCWFKKFGDFSLKAKCSKAQRPQIWIKGPYLDQRLPQNESLYFIGLISARIKIPHIGKFFH